MEQHSNDNSTCQPTGHYAGDPASMAPITQFRIEERARWKRRAYSLIFIGLLFSVLVHLIIFLFSYSVSSDGGSGSQEAVVTTIEFAILDEQAFSSLPEGEKITQSESSQTEASEQLIETTQATLAADSSSTSLIPSSDARATSLTGSGSTGMGIGMGGSGGGGTSFFGISSSGSRFCYIVDRSGSMDRGNRLEDAKAELIASLKKLPDFVKFYVLFYSTGITSPSMQKGWNTARRGTINRIAKEIRSFSPTGGTVPMPAFKQAFELSPPPDVIFFLTDGQINNFSLEMLQSLMPNNKAVVVHTIAFGDASSQTLLQEIASATGGEYRFVKEGSVP